MPVKNISYCIGADLNCVNYFVHKFTRRSVLFRILFQFFRSPFPGRPWHYRACGHWPWSVRWELRQNSSCQPRWLGTPAPWSHIYCKTKLLTLTKRSIECIGGKLNGKSNEKQNQTFISLYLYPTILRATKAGLTNLKISGFISFIYVRTFHIGSNWQWNEAVLNHLVLIFNPKLDKSTEITVRYWSLLYLTWKYSHPIGWEPCVKTASNLCVCRFSDSGRYSRSSARHQVAVK